MEFTIVTAVDSPTSLTRRIPSSKLPNIWMITAPCIIAWASLPWAILPSGIKTKALMPARPAYAAAEAEVFPVEAQMIALEPSDTA